MSLHRAVLLSTSLLVASAAAAQSTPAAPVAEPAGPQAPVASAPSTPPASAPTVPEGGQAAPRPPARLGLGVSLGGRGWTPRSTCPSTWIG
jgi:hypothetical protein